MLRLTADFTKKFILLTLLVTPTLLSAQMVPQQQNVPPADYTTEQLETFVKAVLQVMTIQEEGQMRMVTVVENNDLSVDRFNEMLMQAQHQGEESIAGTEEEVDAFHNTINELETMQMQLQEDMMEAITDEGMDIMEYQTIMQAYEVNPELKEKIDEIFALMQ